MRQSQYIVAMASLLRALTRWLGKLASEPVRPYRREAHYMRGPGPAWRAKHGKG